MAEVIYRGNAGKSISLVPPLSFTAVAMAFLLFAYAFCYEPFVFISYLSAPLRISLEGFVLFLTLVINIYYKYSNMYRWLIAITFLFACFPLLGVDTVVKIVASYNKLLFLILVVGLFSCFSGVLKAALTMWIGLWRLLCYLSIGAFIGYSTHTIAFSELYFGDINEGALYSYMHNFIFGNIVPRNFYDIEFGRVAGHMFEPGLASFFYGFNILVSRRWFADEKRARKFILLNFAAGLTTVSMTFLFFIAFYIFTNVSLRRNKLNFELKVLLVVGLIILYIAFSLYLISSGLMEFSSSDDRILRLQSAMEIMENNTWLSSLFGNGVGVSVNKMEMGISAGLLNILIERGAVTLLLIGLIFHRFSKHNRWLLFYLIYYNLMFEMFWYPIFLLGIAIAYVYAQKLPKEAAYG